MALLVTGLLPPGKLERDPLGGGDRVRLAGLIALGSAGLAMLAAAIGPQALPPAPPLPRTLVRADAVTFLILPLVGLLVALVARFSRSYLEGEGRRQGRYFRWFALTAGGFMLVVVAGNLALFAAAIIFTGSGLHRLLTHYEDRRPAQMVAHKKLLFSRVADACLVLAAILTGAAVGDTGFATVEAAVAEREPGLLLTLSAWLVVAYAILKSGQFPFHGWLLQVMEAPTPVSALLHAGIVYSGALAVLRTHELLLVEGHAMLLLALVGLITAGLASLAMLTQTAIKSSLAWSTAAQLGFMLLELGLGLFVLALLHLVAHSLYKAHAFLSSGSIVDMVRAPGSARKAAGVGTGTWLSMVVTALLATLALGALVGITPADEPALLALGVILAVATTQLVLPVRAAGLPAWQGVLPAVAVVAVYFALHGLFAAVFGGTLAPIPSAAGPLEYLLLLATAGVFLGLSWLQVVGIHRPGGPWMRRLYVHLYNGLYTDLPVERLVYRIWPARFRRSTTGGKG